MVRAVIYLLLAGAVWLVEGFLFSYFLKFHPWQIALMAVMYVSLFLVAVRYLFTLAGRPTEDRMQLTHWRYLSLAPMLVVVLGSFVSLPLLLLMVAIGRL